MKCPKCKKGNVTCVDSVTTPANEILRRKKCLKCKHVFFTVEEVADEDLQEYVKTQLYKHKNDIYRNKEKKCSLVEKELKSLNGKLKF